MLIYQLIRFKCLHVIHSTGSLTKGFVSLPETTELCWCQWWYGLLYLRISVKLFSTFWCMVLSHSGVSVFIGAQ